MEEICITNGPEIIGTVIGVVVTVASVAANIIAKFGKGEKWYGKLVNFLAVNIKVDPVKK